MTRIRIPARLDEHLGQSSLATSVRLYVQQFDKWLDDGTKGLFFFPEYTDHGPEHVSSVLAGAEALILEDAWKALTSEDVAVLVTAALLHDSAMHLSADGFLALLDPARSAERPIIRPLDDKTWPELFEAFFAEARRWDQRKLHRILGDDATPVKKVKKEKEEKKELIEYIKRPADIPDPEDWAPRYCKFLGEFIRRHHARLAHEIALSGYPGHQPNVLLPPAELSKYADLAGLVARSHNMHLRDTFGYLQDKYWGRMTCRNAHPIFLMVLLRIADYLEIRSDRVSPTALQIQRLRSPISQEEQASHLSIHDVHPDEHDEEAIFVITKPASARMFLKLQSLLKGLQAELDTSWAVLGEAYSRNPDLRRFGIRLRRVRSNLDTPADFLRRDKPDYFPIQAAFDTTGADLLKLLIKPLYGDRPEIGIRELLQNALDAVHELRQWARDHGDPTMKRIPRPQQSADVSISIDGDEEREAWLTVRDKGIGMTPEVVRDYFLKAGASYRESLAWRERFEKDEGGSKVLRSGRFGIGALAAFLLGERIEVVTRHVSMPAHFGIVFSASISDDIVELKLASLPEIGTTIRIKLGMSALRRLQGYGLGDSWDWYTLDDPKVELRSFGVPVRQTLQLPQPGKEKHWDWIEIRQSVYRRLMLGMNLGKLELVCNGIRVGALWIESEWHKSAQIDWYVRGIPFSIPCISVTDPDGRLPLNLQRNSLVTPVPPLEDEIIAELTREVCSLVLAHAPSGEHDFVSWNPRLLEMKNLFGWFERHGRPLCFTGKGVAFFHSWSLRRMKARSCLFYLTERSNDLSGMALPVGDDQVKVLLGLGPSDSLHRSAMIPDPVAIRMLTQWGKHAVGAGHYFSLSNEIKLAKGWHIYEFGELADESPVEQSLEDIYNILELDKRRASLTVLEWRFPQEIEVQETAFTRTLDEIWDSAIVPYDPVERRRQFPGAFERLEKYLERWQPEKLKGWRLKQVEWFTGGPVDGVPSKPKKGRSRSRKS